MLPSISPTEHAELQRFSCARATERGFRLLPVRPQFCIPIAEIPQSHQSRVQPGELSVSDVYRWSGLGVNARAFVAVFRKSVILVIISDDACPVTR